MSQREAVFTNDKANKTIKVTKTFAAPLQQVWNAWTQSEILDQWWGPKPYKAETKSMDFREGGEWLYCMTGPDDFKQWSKENYKTIIPNKQITAVDAFCDENGKVNDQFPSSQWTMDFTYTDNETTVNIELAFNTEADMQKLIDTGFQQGFTAGLNNLDELLKG